MPYEIEKTQDKMRKLNFADFLVNRPPKADDPLVNPVAVELASAAVAVIVRHAGTLRSALLGRRATNPQDPWSGQIAFPGGRSEA